MPGVDVRIQTTDGQSESSGSNSFSNLGPVSGTPAPSDNLMLDYLEGRGRSWGPVAESVFSALGRTNTSVLELGGVFGTYEGDLYASPLIAGFGGVNLPGLEARLDQIPGFNILYDWHFHLDEVSGVYQGQCATIGGSFSGRDLITTGSNVYVLGSYVVTPTRIYFVSSADAAAGYGGTVLRSWD